MGNFTVIVLALVALAIGALAGVLIQRNVTSKRIGEANDLARRIVEEARKEAQAQKKEILLQGQNEVFSQKHALEAEYKEQERVLKNREKKLQDITDRMEEKMERITQKEQDILHQEKEQTQYQAMKDRVQFLYEQGDSYYLELLLDVFAHQIGIRADQVHIKHVVFLLDVHTDG